jgi:hypothetical protein
LYESRNGAGQGDPGHSPRPVYPVTKAERCGVNEFDFSAERIERSVDESLRRLNGCEPIGRQALQAVMAILQPIHNETWPSGRPVYNEKKTRK